jgi:hypothetical protein
MTVFNQRQIMSEFYQRKLYALLPADKFGQNWQCLSDSLPELEKWWQDKRDDSTDKNWTHLSEAIASSSDRVNLTEKQGTWDKIKHPISGQPRLIHLTDSQITQSDIAAIAHLSDRVFGHWQSLLRF